MTLSSTLEVNNFSDVIIKNFSIQKNLIEEGESTYFLVEVENVGNMFAENVQGEIRIFDSSNVNVANLTILSFILLQGESNQLQVLLPSTLLSAANYSAYCNIISNSSSKNSSFINFSVIKKQLPPPSPGSSGGSSSSSGGGALSISKITTQAQQELIELKQAPPSSKLSLEAVTFFKDVYAGQKDYILIKLKNNVNEPILVNLNSSNIMDISFNPMSNLILNPQSTFSIPIEIKIPKNLSSGLILYKVFVNYENSSFAVPIVLYIKPLLSSNTVLFSREINLDFETNSSNFILITKNNKNVSISYLQILEYFPKNLLKSVVSYSFSPTNISDDSLIRWDVDSFSAEQTLLFKKTIAGIIGDFSFLDDWAIKQVAINNQPKKLFKDIYLTPNYVPSFFPSQKDVLVVDITNTAGRTINVSLLLEPPPKWEVDETSITLSLLPKESRRLKFVITSPSSYAEGTHGFKIKLKYEDVFEETIIPVVFYSSSYSLSLISSKYVQPLAKIFEFLEANAIFLGSIVAVLILLFLAYKAISYYRSIPKADEGRTKSIEDIQKLISFFEEDNSIDFKANKHKDQDKSK
jgi:hypothetical protein